MVHCVVASIVGNSFKSLGNNWIQVKNYESVLVKDNHFETFTPIQLNGDHSMRTSCTFENNSIRNPLPGSLNFDCEVRATSVDHICRCDDLQQLMPTLTDHDISSELYCQLPDRLASCFNVSQMHMRRYANEVCGKNQTSLRCLNGNTLERDNDGFFTKQEIEERRRGYSIGTIVAACLIMLAIVAAIILCCAALWKRFLNKNKQYCSLSPENLEKLQQKIELLPKNTSNEAIRKHLKKLINSKHTVQQCHARIIELINIKRIPKDIEQILKRHLEYDPNHCNPNNNESNNEALLLNNSNKHSTEEPVVQDYSEPMQSISMCDHKTTQDY